MKSFLVGFCSLLLLSVALVSCGDADTAKVGASPLNTIPDGIKVEALFTIDQFKSPETCGGCHDQIYQQWQGSMMNYSFTDPLYQAVHKQASDDTAGATDTFCSACHGPIGVFTGEVPPLDGPQVSEISKQGVQCDFCHSIDGATGIGNYSFTLSPSNIKRGPYNDSISPFHSTQYLELITRSEFCGTCHDVNHPGNGLALEATYSEWKESPYAENGIQCQDCHMTPGPGVTKPNPGKATSNSVLRPMLYTHNFVGGNAALADDTHKELAIQQLQAAADVAVSPPPSVTAGQEVQVSVGVTNKGAGHYLPTGLTEVREMWLDVEVVDADGKTVYRSGEVDADGAIDPEAVIYHTVFKDKNGDPTHKPWFADQLLSDHRIPPMETVTEQYRFMVPADAAMPLAIKATLRYRSGPQSVVDEVMGADAPTLPIIDMAQATVSAG